MPKYPFPAGEPLPACFFLICLGGSFLKNIDILSRPYVPHWCVIGVPCGLPGSRRVLKALYLGLSAFSSSSCVQPSALQASRSLIMCTWGRPGQSLRGPWKLPGGIVITLGEPARLGGQHSIWRTWLALTGAGGTEGWTWATFACRQRALRVSRSVGSNGVSPC